METKTRFVFFIQTTKFSGKTKFGARINGDAKLPSPEKNIQNPINGNPVIFGALVRFRHNKILAIKIKGDDLQYAGLRNTFSRRTRAVIVYYNNNVSPSHDARLRNTFYGVTNAASEISTYPHYQQ